MKKYKIALMWLCSLVTAIALSLGVASAQAVCIFNFHQPKVPQGMSKFTVE
ncbi:MAG: cyclic lactone autoinducer peptide [Oscillospiraceae bacterium]|nr:cyclic lactone autoinducer peptide [Oscillospiraceae bacterium]